MTTRLSAAPADAPGVSIRIDGPAALAQALRSSRDDTLATYARLAAALGDGTVVPQAPTLNPPLWELGHIGWFQDHWIARNPQRRAGHRADPAAPRLAPQRADADALYDSGRVAHDARWSLPLPDAAATRADLDAQLSRTLALLADTEVKAGTGAGDDDALYFFRLVLMHEDMHHEAALMLAQSLGIAVSDPRWQPAPLPYAVRALDFEAADVEIGSSGPGFAFDNELGPHRVAVDAFDIDSRVLCWADFMPFVESGGYDDDRWWSADGAAWRDASGRREPDHLRRVAGGWQQRRWGHWVDLDPSLPACHLSAHEADAWCAWAGRRLPTEAEWELAALASPPDFDWGSVWEWTATTFGPYPGFVAHPYRDYSAPWFGTRRVLRGASFATQPRMRHPRYRNFFEPSRNDVFAGFRTCARR